MNRFKFMVRLTGPEWIKFRNDEFKYDDKGVLHVPTGWIDGQVRVTTVVDMDVYEIEYDGPLSGHALELLEILVEYPVLGENDPFGS